MDSAGTYTFTQDWFHWAPEVWAALAPHLPARQKFLEIGSFEGRSTVWTVENMLEDGGLLVAVDTWEGGEEHTEDTLAGVEGRFDNNVALLRKKHHARRVEKLKTNSVQAMRILGARDKFDFIYIDGDHRAPGVLTDACMAWTLLKPGGVLVFDDYLWGADRDVLHRPKLAIDAFVNVFAEHLTVLHLGYQLIIKKKES